MPASRSLLLSIFSATATVALLLLGTPQVASAWVTPDAAATSVDRDSYRSTPGTAPSPNVVSPSGCVQRADYPHKSFHFPGTADGVVTTTCNRYVPEIAHTAQMWETRWWGWDRIGHKGVIARFQVRTASATAWDWCKKNTVRVTGSGHVIDVDQRWYYASTESIHVTNPCHL